MKIIVGLGNPGEKYEKTRHNVGFMFLDFLSGNSDSWVFNKKFNALIFEKGDLVLIKPLSFMNNSGLVIRSFLSYYKLLPKKMGLIIEKNSDLSDLLTLVHDDLDIDFGSFKKSFNSSSAGHNGVQSTIDNLKTKNFKRIRIGINNQFRKHLSGADFVLQRFSKEELSEIDSIFKSIEL